MYVSNNIYQKEIQYIDLPDYNIVEYMVRTATRIYESGKQYFENLSQSDIKNIKNNMTPVIYGTTIAGGAQNGHIIERTKFNEIARRRYLVIDADYNVEQSRLSEAVREKMIELSSTKKIPLIIYPTISYPEKPRFRAFFFIKDLLNAQNYYKAIAWLHDELGIKPTDKMDFYITSNNNAPIFTNEDQLNAIYIKNFDKLPSIKEEIKGYEAPKFEMKSFEEKCDYDEQKLDFNKAIKAAEKYGLSKTAKSYHTFWPFIQTLVRAELSGQLKRDDIYYLLDIVAETAADNNILATKWKLGNRKQYQTEYSILSKNHSRLERVKPLLLITEFKKVGK